jgi:hypothetical protein
MAGRSRKQNRQPVRQLARTRAQENGEEKDGNASKALLILERSVMSDFPPDRVRQPLIPRHEFTHYANMSAACDAKLCRRSTGRADIERTRLWAR